jgi:hypothetical protein
MEFIFPSPCLYVIRAVYDPPRKKKTTRQKAAYRQLHHPPNRGRWDSVAILAPTIASTPPRKAMTARLPVPWPKYLFQVSGTACSLKVPVTREDIKDPSRTPHTNIHCHSILMPSLA